MNFLDLTLPTPAENLACDEALLDLCDKEGTEILRFWESPEHFVTLGYGNPAATEVNLDACQARKIPVLRRCTGGGTVVQGPGCLNYALILSIANDGPLHSITSTNRFVMEHNRTAIAAALANSQSAIGNRQCNVEEPKTQNSKLKSENSSIAVLGCTDLAIGGLKFSGNAQRRKKRALLFHGCFLIDFNLPLISELLRFPSRQPDYRQSRSHADFLTNLNLSRDSAKSALRQIWNAGEPFDQAPVEAIAALALNKYSLKAWNFKF